MTDPPQRASGVGGGAASLPRAPFNFQVTIDKFSGKAKENPEMFIRSVESARALYGWDNEQTLAYVGLQLKGKALEWYCNQEPASWQELKAAMTERFGTDPNRMLSALTRRVQRETETVRDYADGLRTLVRYSRELHLQATLRHFFIAGLRPDVQYFVKSRRPETFEDAVAEGEYYEENISGSAAGTTAVASQNQRGKDDTNPFVTQAAVRKVLQDHNRNHSMESLTRQMERLTIKLHEMDRRLAGRTPLQPRLQPQLDAAGGHKAVNFAAYDAAEDYETSIDDEEDPEIYCVEYCNTQHANSWRGQQWKPPQPANKPWWPAPNLIQVRPGVYMDAGRISSLHAQPERTTAVASKQSETRHTARQPRASLKPAQPLAVTEASHLLPAKAQQPANQHIVEQVDHHPEPYPESVLTTIAEEASHKRVWKRTPFLQDTSGLDPATPSEDSPDTKEQPQTTLLPFSKENTTRTHTATANEVHNIGEIHETKFKPPMDPGRIDTCLSRGDSNGAKPRQTADKPAAAGAKVKEAALLHKQQDINTQHEDSKSNALTVLFSRRARPPGEGQESHQFKNPHELLSNSKLATGTTSAAVEVMESKLKPQIDEKMMTELESYMAFGSTNLLHEPATPLLPPPTAGGQGTSWAGNRQRRYRDSSTSMESVSTLHFNAAMDGHAKKQAKLFDKVSTQALPAMAAAGPTAVAAAI